MALERVVERRQALDKVRAAILFLDEGTAHLDVDNERYINESLKRLPMTRVSVAHRPEMSSGTDRILRIGKTLSWTSRASQAAPIAAD